MAIYSRKYGRTFKNRSELQRYAWWDYRTRPIMNWFGLRNRLYSDSWRRERHPKLRKVEPETLREWIRVIIIAAVIILGLELLKSCAG